MDIRLHDLGEGMHEAEIVRILVAVGDEVATNEAVLEVQTDKMIAELTAPKGGTVTEICVAEGDEVSVGDLLVKVDSGQEEAHEQEDRSQEQSEMKTEQLSKEMNRDTSIPKRVLATPYTRRLARERNIDIEQMIPKDPSGRITEEDVLQYDETSVEQVSEQTTSIASPPALEKEERVNVIPFKGIRKATAKQMVRSLYTIPHVTHFEEIEMSALFELRHELKEEGHSIRLTSFIYKAVTIALKKFPIFNATLDEEAEQIILYDVYHLGLATNTEAGLIVPVLPNVDEMTLQQLDQEVAHLTERALNGQLELHEMKGSTFTISNVGPIGSTGATPIINYPETGLLALHQIRKRPIVNDQDEIVVGQVMNVSLSYDHRLIDGATGIAFTNELKRLLENPKLLMLEMI